MLIMTISIHLIDVCSKAIFQLTTNYFRWEMLVLLAFVEKMGVDVLTLFQDMHVYVPMDEEECIARKLLQ